MAESERISAFVCGLECLLSSRDKLDINVGFSTDISISVNSSSLSLTYALPLKAIHSISYSIEKSPLLLKFVKTYGTCYLIIWLL